MSKTTIFGEENFIDKSMISIIEERGKAIDNMIYEEIEGVARYELKMPKIVVDKEKVKKWLTLCSQLENIEHSKLIEIATKKKITNLTHENKILAKALELACEKLANIIIKDCTSIKEGEEALLYCDKNWFLQQAKRS